MPKKKEKLPLSKTHPKLATEAYGWDPSIITASSKEKVEWVCKYGHIWPAAIYSRASGRGCPYCSNRSVLAGFNDLSTTHPKLAREAHGWDPTTISSGSESKKEWICPIGHIYSAAPMSRSRKDKGRGCPYCSHQKFLVGFNDLASTHPSIARLAYKWDPTTLLAGSREIRKWKCEKGHITEGSVFNRTRADSSCPVCSGNEILKGFNDLTTTHKILSLEAHGWDPTKVSAGSNMKVDWKCPKGHIFSSTIASRALSGNGCPVCVNQQVLPGFNDLLTTHPDIAKQASGWDPSTLTFGHTKKKLWKCSLEHQFISSPSSRTSKMTGCPICSNQVLLVGFNDLKTKFPKIAVEADGWNPKMFIAGSRAKKQWKCSEGHIYFATLDSRTSKSTGCPSCAKFGFDPNNDGWLYLMEHQDLGYLQIGITNKPKDRLTAHKRSGWILLQLRGPMEGHLAANWETSILKMLRSKGATMGPGKLKLNNKLATKVRQHIGTEMWLKKSFPVESIKELMRITEEFEES